MSTSPSTSTPADLAAGQPAATHELHLAITGMTCASCSARIERKLTKLPGVRSVSVNLATEKAQVGFTPPLTSAQIVAEVEMTGYGAAPIVSSAPRTPPDAARPSPATASAPTDAKSKTTPNPATAPPRTAQDLVRLRLIVATALTVPVFLLAMVIPDFAASGWLELVLATPVVLWCAWPFHRAAALNARHLASTMDTLVSIGVLAAWGYSVAQLLTGGSHLYFEVAAVVTTFLLIGRFLEARAKDSGKDALSSLLDLGAKDVAVLRIDPTTRTTGETRIPIGDLVVGDRFIVRPGEKVASDGTVSDGQSAVDAALITGESTPVDVGPGDPVTGGSINTNGRLVVETTRVGGDTMLAGIQRLVESAQTGKAEVQRLADRVSAVFVPAVLAIAIVTFVAWLATGHELSRALAVAVTVLIIACPCALGLATPTALLVGTGRGAQLGTLIKGPQVLEDTRRVDTIVLDKTGTVTTGRLSLSSIAVRGSLPKKAALTAAAAVEQGSEHPIARAIVAGAEQAHLSLPDIRDFLANPGEGATAKVRGTEVSVGKAVLFESVDDSLLAHASGQGGTTVFVGWDGAAQAALTVQDSVRESSAAAITRLEALGLTTYLLTGDGEATAKAVAHEVGIAPERVRADVMPADKHQVVLDLQGQGRVVAMVGDGINDAAALAQADLGMAMGSGTDVAIDSADIVLVRADLDAVGDAIELSRETLKVVKQNLAWAFGYNIAALPLAAFGLLNPMVAGGAMAFSSVLVVTNSLRLKRFGRKA